ncbi:MAG: helix-turn-helix domain-containing protein [Acidimicrobiia bacterium]
MTGRLPALLTVEEAAEVLRIGRTKAYAMAQEWRDTGGRSGLPVVDPGHVLRVPLRQLEAIIGGSLVADDQQATSTVMARKRPSAEPRARARDESSPAPTTENASTPSRKPRRRTNRRLDDQLNLFNPKHPTS